ncbi:MAG: xanthine dehydrogenase family protein molybdopterin-binding subunit [Actinomycetota bacterium]|nr:xanthine dehydrogenase family protein molybdopterin-binding subunit [Actinomycetota bacterium]
MTFAAASSRLVGSRINRKEDPRLLTGRGRYVDDVVVPDMLNAAFARSDIARGRIVSIETTAAAAAPGVVAVLTGTDLNPLLAGPIAATPTLGMGSPGPHKVLADDEVRYVGDPYAMVVARSRAEAEDAVELIELDVESLVPVADYTTALLSDERVHPQLEDNRAGGMVQPLDDELRTLLESAPYSATDTFVQNRYLAVPMETRGIVAWWDPGRMSFDIWVSTQSPHDVRTVTARVTGVSENQVRVQMGDVGGGFGQKAYLARDEQIVILASYHLGCPVKWIEDRRENLVAATSSRAERATVSIAADQLGNILGVRVDHIDEVGAYPMAGSAAMMGAVIFTGPYRIPKLSFSTDSVYTNTCSRAPYRGPWQIETYVREQAVDSLARNMGLDPIELRRRNVLQRDQLPYLLPIGLSLDHVSPAETLEQAAAMIDYDGFRAWQRQEFAAGRLVGVGIGLYIEPQSAMGPYAAEPAHIRIQPDGSTDVYLGSGSHGQGIETTTAQIVSENVGVPFDTVKVHQGDTGTTPYAFGTGGSRSGPILGAAIQLAARDLRSKIVEIAAHQLEASPDDIEVTGGVAAVRGTPTRARTIGEISRSAYLDLGALPPGMEPGLETLKRYKTDMPFLFSNACHMCTVEVDGSTGSVRILRFVVSEDCGVMINPSVVEGQIAGGAVQGIGGALLEDFIYDADGNPLTTTFLDYLLPTASDVPQIEYGHVETPATTPGGFKGVGEGGAIGAPAAVANAVNDALHLVGARVREAPFSPARIVEALEAVGR